MVNVGQYCHFVVSIVLEKRKAFKLNFTYIICDVSLLVNIFILYFILSTIRWFNLLLRQRATSSVVSSAGC